MAQVQLIALLPFALSLLCNADKPPVEPLPFDDPQIPLGAYFGETFRNKLALQERWLVSKGKKQNDAGEDTSYDGKWEIGLPRDVLLINDYGLIMKSPARHHAISAKLNRVFNFATSSLVMQYDITFQDMMECGGGYVKLITHSAGVDLNYFNNKTPFTIMFGPDKCGANGKVHLIIRHKSPVTDEITEHAAPQSSTSFTGLFQDKKAHLFTLVLNSDDSYYVYLDQREVMRGNLLQDLQPPIIPPKDIDDPSDKKPETWDEREKIPEMNAVKPDDWDESEPEYIEDMDAVKPKDWLEDEPEFVPDVAATPPDDWDENMDGKWEPPMIANPKCTAAAGCGVWRRPTKKNPAYKGPWKPPLIANPNYQGKWKPRKIANPEYFELHNVFKTLQPITAVGLELWTITPEVIFDNFLITSSEAEAKEFAKQTWQLKRSAESLREENTGFFRNLIKETESKPWLWAVYILIVLLPMVVLGLWCFGPSKKVNEVKENDLSQAIYDELEEEEEINLADEELIRDEQMLGEDSMTFDKDMCEGQLGVDDDEKGWDETPVPERRSVRRQDD